MQEELKRSENTCRLLDEENLKLIKENEELMTKIKELEEMLQPYKDEIQKLINENNKLKGKAFVPRTQEITNRGSVLKMRISHVKSIFPADTNGLQTF